MKPGEYRSPVAIIPTGIEQKQRDSEWLPTVLDAPRLFSELLSVLSVCP